MSRTITVSFAEMRVTLGTAFHPIIDLLERQDREMAALKNVVLVLRGRDIDQAAAQRDSQLASRVFAAWRGLLADKRQHESKANQALARQRERERASVFSAWRDVASRRARARRTIGSAVRRRRRRHAFEEAGRRFRETQHDDLQSALRLWSSRTRRLAARRHGEADWRERLTQRERQEQLETLRRWMRKAARPKPLAEQAGAGDARDELHWLRAVIEGELKHAKAAAAAAEAAAARALAEAKMVAESTRRELDLLRQKLDVRAATPSAPSVDLSATNLAVAAATAAAHAAKAASDELARRVDLLARAASDASARLEALELASARFEQRLSEEEQTRAHDLMEARKEARAEARRLQALLDELAEAVALGGRGHGDGGGHAAAGTQCLVCGQGTSIERRAASPPPLSRAISPSPTSASGAYRSVTAARLAATAPQLPGGAGQRWTGGSRASPPSASAARAPSEFAKMMAARELMTHDAWYEAAHVSKDDDGLIGTDGHLYRGGLATTRSSLSVTPMAPAHGDETSITYQLHAHPAHGARARPTSAGPARGAHGGAAASPSPSQQQGLKTRSHMHAGARPASAGGARPTQVRLDLVPATATLPSTSPH
jgi:hypothetical protein